MKSLLCAEGENLRYITIHRSTKSPRMKREDGCWGLDRGQCKVEIPNMGASVGRAK